MTDIVIIIVDTSYETDIEAVPPADGVWIEQIQNFDPYFTI